MNTKQLQEIPVFSGDAVDDGTVTYDDLNITLTLRFYEEKPMLLKIMFQTALCHIHTTERFTENFLNAYDTLVEVEDSPWIERLKAISAEDVAYWRVKHFAIFLKDMGMYQVIAQSYKITYEEEENEP